MSRLPSFFLCHGGGPWPWMDGPYRAAHAGIEAMLRGLLASLPAPPRALLMISGHWEAPAFTVQSGAAPGMVYDYAGFPPHTYGVRHAAPGEPALAERVRQLVEASGLPAAQDAARGFDHGAFCTAFPMDPAARLPMVQLSLRHGLVPAEHLRLGRALAPLRGEGVLIVGSGFSFHNLRLYGPQGREPSTAFDAWLQAVLPVPEGRDQALVDWSRAPSARLAHPREEHLLPLMVAVGAASAEVGLCIHHETGFLGGTTISSWRFG
ncbi:MAG: dioxygenase [Burkholderiales bacterium]|nr:dioxygenase [Burkholderiales bacterium]